jgi:hypothetical protein
VGLGDAGVRVGVRPDDVATDEPSLEQALAASARTTTNTQILTRMAAMLRERPPNDGSRVATLPPGRIE